MRRLLLLIPVLLVAAVAVFVLNRGGSGEGEPSAAGLTADVMPFPSSTKPLPVPQMRIGTGPWADALQGIPASKIPSARIPRDADELKRCVVQVPRFSEDLPNGTGGQFKTCVAD